MDDSTLRRKNHCHMKNGLCSKMLVPLQESSWDQISYPRISGNITETKVGGTKSRGPFTFFISFFP